MRHIRLIGMAGVLLSIGLIAGSCTKASNTTGTKGTLASTFVFGAPPDCATNKFCAQGLKSKYGIVFKEVKSLDFGGPATVAAIKSGTIQVGELFSTSVYDSTFKVLVDDKHLEAADNIAPVMRTQVATPIVGGLLNAISAKLTTSGMLALNKKADIDHQDPAAIAKTFLQEKGLLASKTNDGAGKTIKVGVSGAFAESKIVAEMYAQVLENAGFTVQRQLELQSRKVSDAALFAGDIDLKPEYLASEALALDPNADATGDPTHTSAVLAALLKSRNVAVLHFSSAVDTNVFVVTKATANKYKLSKVSDLAKPAG